ncbi:MAG TPA: hypothetical protein VGR34_05585 [Candidatus Dormibacteraeota bacterium]|nr:hypothetical protein [Candidatus Dormibacteraeota bacterium]
MPTSTDPGTRRKQIEAERRGLVQRLPTRFRTRRGFAFLLGTLAFFGYGGWYLIQGQGVLSSLLAAVASAVAAFLFFWWVFSRVGSGFDD